MVDLYAPFGVTIVDADPGAVPHLELAIAGDPADLGFGSVGGNSPFNCSFVDNGIAFAFANIFGDNPRAICEQAAQVSGSLAGLDHEFSCPDVMTFLSGCGDKSFTDADAQCGEFQARACACGGSTQNSFQTLSGLYGPGPVCGDGNQDPAETCDDGNTTPGDGCSDTCQIEAPAPLPLWGLAALGALLVLAVAIRTPSRLL
jgi:cysteine-rich repeat protein